MCVGLAVPESGMLFLVLGALRTTEMALILQCARTFSGDRDGVIITWERHG